MGKNIHPVTKQMMGLPLAEGHDHKVEYQLKSKHRRVVMSFDHEEHARIAANARGLDLFKVTTITERLD